MGNAKHIINEAMVIPLQQYVTKMVNAGFKYNYDTAFNAELKRAIEYAIIPVLKKYGYIVQTETGYDWSGIKDVDLDEASERAIRESINKYLNSKQWKN